MQVEGLEKQVDTAIDQAIDQADEKIKKWRQSKMKPISNFFFFFW